MYYLRSKGRHLGELESTVMDIIWTRGEATVRDIHQHLTKKRDLAYTTVLTVMVRLFEKKMLARQALGDGSFLYTPCLSREEFYAQTSRALYTELIRDFGSVAVAQFVDTLEEVDPKQLQALRARLQKK